MNSRQAQKLTKRALRLMERVLGTASARPHLAGRGASVKERRDRVPYGKLLAMFAAQSHRSLKSMLMLQESGLTIDSLLHFRKLLEMFFDVGYIRDEPVARTKKFLDYEVVIGMRLSGTVKRMSSSHPLRPILAHKILSDSDPRIQRYNKLPKSWRKKVERFGWAGKTVRQLAKAKDLYDFFYGPISDVMHSNIAGLRKTARVSSDQALILCFDEDPELGAPWLVMAAACALAVLALFDEEADLGFGIEIDEFAKTLRTTN